MFKFVVMVPRRSDFTRESFLKRWKEGHGPLVRRHAEALGVRRYVQSHRVESEYLNSYNNERSWADCEYDGVTGFWVDSLEALAACLATPERKLASAILREDENEFVDHTRVKVFCSEEHEIIPPDRP